MLALKELALRSTEVVCVNYTDQFSIDGNSLNDLQVGCKHGAVSSNQTELKKAENGSLAIVTSQDGHFVVGLLGDHIIGPCTVWRQEGGGLFKYARKFTPITDVLLKKTVRATWEAVCDVHDVKMKPIYLFNQRFCKYGSSYIDAMHDAIKHGVFPMRTATGTRTVFE